MDFFSALVLGIVEGVTEFLPVSSTGHLILTSHLLRLPQTEFLKSFEVIIQLGAILSVIVLYRKVLLQDIKTLKRVLVAFLPTALLGLIFYKLIKECLSNGQLVVWSLFLGGIFLIIFEQWYKKKEISAEDVGHMTYKKAVLIGLFQSLSMIPGVSRAGATIIGGLALGLNRKTIVEFSFLLAIPTMVAATGLDLLHNAHSFNKNQLKLLTISFITSFIIKLLSIKFLLQFIKNNNFIPFGIYRILIAIVFWCLGVF